MWKSISIHKMPKFLFLFFLVGLCITPQLTQAQDSLSVRKPTRESPAPVVFENDTLFYIQQKIGAFSAMKRANLVRENIKKLAKLQLSEFDSLQVLTYSNSADLVYKEQIIATVTENDALLESKTVEQVANEHLEIIKSALIADYNNVSIGNLLKDIAFFLLTILGFYLIFRGVNKVFDYFRRNLKDLQKRVYGQKKFSKLFSLISPTTQLSILLVILRGLRISVIAIFIYLYLPFMFSQISYTRGFGEKLLEYVLSPLRFIFHSFGGFLPNLLFIIVIISVVRYALGGLKNFASQVKSEQIKFEGFYADWALPTFNLFRALIIIFTLVILFPYLPGAGSDAFQGVSVFIGLLLSLGSAGAISNVISGVILTYMRPFKMGDRVKINDVTGDIISRNLLVTKVKTLKNEEITIPNASLLGNGIVNYTTLASAEGIILHTTITIGYDVPWVQVHKLMIEAARRTQLVEAEPEPFVLQKSLDDWYVAYELNCFTHESHKMPRIYSELHSHIQDVFNESEVEIMSSHYMAIRDGNAVAMPPKKN